jgi:hypothetical protein
MNTNNLYEKVNQPENQVNYEELYGRNDRKNNPEQIFNTRFNEGINILRQQPQSQTSALDKNQIFNDDNNYDANKNYYNRYQNNYINRSLMNCEEGSGVGNFAVFKSDPNSNNYINSLTNQNQQKQQQQQMPRQPVQQQQIPRQPVQSVQQQMPRQSVQSVQQQLPRQPVQSVQQQSNQQLTQQKCNYCINQMQNRR